MTMRSGDGMRVDGSPVGDHRRHLAAAVTTTDAAATDAPAPDAPAADAAATDAPAPDAAATDDSGDALGGTGGEPAPGRGLRAVAVTVAVVVAVAIPLATTGVLDADRSQAVDDFGQLLAGAFAALCSCITWRRAVRAGRPRSAWLWRLLFFLGTFGWTCGQAVWTWYQVAEHRELPSPSLADVGYFMLPLFALPAMLALPAGRAPEPVGAEAGEPPRGQRSARLLLGLDAVVIVGSLFLLTWATALGAAVHARASDGLAFLIAVGYPATDLMLVVLVLLIAVFRRPRRPQALLLLGAGLVALSVSDSFFLYLVSVGATGMPPLYDIGFLAGPVLIGLAALAPEPASRPGGAPADDARTAVWFALLPYGPLGLIGLLVIVQQVMGLVVTPTESFGLITLIGVVVVRQLLTMLENLSLVRRVREGQDRLHHQAFHDWLTGLPNRALFRDRLEQTVEQHRLDGRRLALLFCDLDDFKRVNDTCGHAAGDELLQVTATRLQESVLHGDTVARLGGDEFAVILDDEHVDPLDVAHRLLAALAEPVTLAGHLYLPQASAGLVIVGAAEQAVTAPLLLHRADAAMYVAKRNGKSRLVSYAPGMDAGRWGPDLAARLSRALAETLVLAQSPVHEHEYGEPDATHGTTQGTAHGTARATGRVRSVLDGFAGHRAGHAPALRLEYQPIVRLADGEMVAVEALARWDHPDSGIVPPELLIQVAETSGLIDALEELILDLACRDVVAVRRGACPGLVVHVNVTASTVTDDALVGRIERTLERHGLPSDALVLEVTETGRIGDFARAAEVLGTIRRLGVRLALDDFGAGNSNLDYLLRLPVDILKLDRTLTVGAGDAARTEAICAGAVQIATRLGVPLIAEGLEDVEQAERLASLGCEFGQGFLFSPPVASGQLRPVRV